MPDVDDAELEIFIRDQRIEALQDAVKWQRITADLYRRAFKFAMGCALAALAALAVEIIKWRDVDGAVWDAGGLAVGSAIGVIIARRMKIKDQAEV